MATDDKKQYFKEKYIKHRKDAKETYKKRKEYLSKETLREENVAGMSLADFIKRFQGSGSKKQKAEGNAEEDKIKKTDNLANIGNGNAIIETAKSKLGAKYVWGAQGPNTFDCSGLVYWVYKENGYTFGRTTAQGYHNGFDKVTEPKMGDLITFDYTNGPSGGNAVKHVGIFIDKDTMIHTANPRVNLEIASMKPFWQQYVAGYRRPPKRYWPKGAQGAESSSLKVASRKITDEEVLEEVNPVIGDDPTPYGSWMEESSIYDKKTLVYPYIPSKIQGEVLKHPNMSREAFLNQRVGWARTTKYKELRHINRKKFIHTEEYDGLEGNLYSPDAIVMFENLLKKTGKKYFEVISGFRFSNKGQVSPHEAGCAMDIRVRTLEEARSIADCAWTLGFKSIAIGGDVERKQFFIHLDICPEGKGYGYGIFPAYKKPGSIDVRRLNGVD